MSGKVTGWLWRNAAPALDYNAADRSLLLVLAVLADRADESGRNARLPVRDIAYRCRLSTRWVQELLARAVTEGWLEITKPGTAKWPTVYRFVHCASPVDNESARGPDRAQRAAQSASKRAAQSASKRAAQTVQDVFDVKTSVYGRGDAPPVKTGVTARGDGGPWRAQRRDLTGDQAELRARRDQAAAGCPRCDELGWDPDREQWCNHALAE